MNIERPFGVLAGFSTGSPVDDAPEIAHAGEQWVPRSFRIGPHSHKQWELFLQLSGESTWVSQGAKFRCLPGALFVAPPNIEHWMADQVPAKHHFLYAAIDIESVLDRLQGAPADWPRSAPIFMEDAGSLTAPFRALTREVSLDLPYRAAGIRAALDALVIEASRLIVGSSKDRSEERAVSGFSHPAVTFARQLLERHLARDWQIEDLAKMVAMSPSHLAECFARDIGMPPHRYLLHRRIAAVEQYLRETELPITDIALELGFSSSQYFATVFKRLRGLSPRQARLGHTPPKVSTAA